MTKVLFITPPFTQLNTPYPATAYLKGFLNTKDIESNQCDFGIEVILELFSRKGLEKLFHKVETLNDEFSVNSERILALKNAYITTIDDVILFLQNKNSTLAHLICDGNYLPEASRFAEVEDLDWAFGTMGLQDKAKHLATLYLEDISDFIKETVDAHFGFSRYAEKLAMSANSFDELETELQTPHSFVDEILITLLKEKIQLYEPNLVCISIPFPGNLLGALRCGQFIKKWFPSIKVAMGGGYPNTELRSLSEPKVFQYTDFILLDDGEAPLWNLIEYVNKKRTFENLKRTFILKSGFVQYVDNSTDLDVAQVEVGTPDYSDLFLDKYLSVLEVVNPMHRLWSDGRWNKLTLAHGCYWGKCSFCDISLNYIKNYEPITASLLCDRIEEIISQTGENGFHFVDEAAPPALLRDLAIEILNRKITISWWTNIRFEKSFSIDLCRLLKASGCIAVSGGLEVASDRLLKMMKKGVSVGQVAKVAENFTESGIMVHSYLMYGFPTQSEQETIDSLEVVRQLFELGIVQSGFWHRFSMTAHSPIGLKPKEFNVTNLSKKGTFANNDLVHEDREGAEHELFGEGLRKSLFNYMHGVCFDFELQEWFDFETPKTTLSPDFIERNLIKEEAKIKSASKFIWLGNDPKLYFYEKKKKGKTIRFCEMIFHNLKEDFVLDCKANLAEWISEKITQEFSYSDLKTSFQKANLGDFDFFIQSDIFIELKTKGWLIV